MPELLEKKPETANRCPEMAEGEIKRFTRLESERRGVWDSMWQTLSQYYLPSMSDINTEKTETRMGWAENIFDTTGIEAARICTTGQSNWATPAAEPWFMWAPPGSLNLMEDDEAARWCGFCTDIALKELARSNYYRVSGMQYKSRTVFGTGQMHIEEGQDSLITCKSRKIGTYCVAQNADGIVDTVYCKFKLRGRQAVQEFGMENLSGKLKKAVQEKSGKGLDEEFWFLHVIRPRDEMEREAGKKDAKNKPVASIYIQWDDKACCKISGYDEMPDSVTRFDEWGSESVWGYSPAFESLAVVRQLNYITRFSDAQHELIANPRILAPASTYGQMDLRPGGVTPYDPNVSNGAKPEEWMTAASIVGTEELLRTKREVVNRMFYTDVFKALSQMQQTYKRPPTAYEIQKLLGESLEQLAPMFMRLITEKCGPDLKRIFGILFRAGRFPPPPRSMFVPTADGRAIRLAMPEVSYTSRLALALKAMQNRATVDTMQFVGEYVKSTGRVDVLDNFDEDKQFRRFALNQGQPPEDLRPMRDVIKMRTARAQQLAQQQAMAMAEQAAGAAGKLGSAPAPLQDAVSQMVAPGS